MIRKIEDISAKTEELLNKDFFKIGFNTWLIIKPTGSVEIEQNNKKIILFNDDVKEIVNILSGI